jgi:biotin operon repressor
MYSIKERDNIVKLYKDDKKSINEIVRTTGISRPTVTKFLKENGIEIEVDKQFNKVPEEEMLSVYNRVINGEKLSVIANELGISVSGVSKRVMRSKKYLGGI